MPTTQIYRQTLTVLKNRDHPYRQQLDLASAGRTMVLEKTSGFLPADLADSLCILLLMLPSANCETKEQLRMFRDSGGFDRFFPADDAATGHRALLGRVPNLDTFDGGGFWGSAGQDIARQHPARAAPDDRVGRGPQGIQPQRQGDVGGVQPIADLGVSATPTTEANVLIEIFGRDLHAEEMIKLDLHIRNRSSTSWKDTLLAAIEHRAKLEEHARRQDAATGMHIRLICLIQVERTGCDQWLPGVVHAEDAREYLMEHPDIGAEQIAVKTSTRDDLKEVDDAGGLLARDCQIRFIITKQALQEGWDCAFAYVLAILTRPSSTSALTQLVGRILRQPDARKTGNRWLDESHVFCFQRQSVELLREVRRGFNREGLGDLQPKLADDEDSPMEPASPWYEGSARASGGRHAIWCCPRS